MNFTRHVLWRTHFWAKTVHKLSHFSYWAKTVHKLSLRKLFEKRVNSSHFELNFLIKSIEKHGFYPARFVDFCSKMMYMRPKVKLVKGKKQPRPLLEAFWTRLQI